MFDGKLTFTYNQAGVLVAFTNESTMNETQLYYLQKLFPVQEEHLAVLAGDSQTLRIKLVTEKPVTFGEFFAAYNYPVERREAEKEWQKMTPADQQKAYESIPAYNYFLMTRSNQNRLYPVSFLRGRKFENDYKALAKAK